MANIDPAEYVEFANRIGQDVIGMCFYDSPFRYLGEDGQERKLDYRIQSYEDLARLLPTNLDHMEPLFDELGNYASTVEGTDVGLFA